MNVWLGWGSSTCTREREREKERVELLPGTKSNRNVQCMCVCEAKSKYLCFMLMRICLTFCHLNIGKRPLPLLTPQSLLQQLVVLWQKNDKCVGALWLALPVSRSANSSANCNCNCSLSCLWFCGSNDHTRRQGNESCSWLSLANTVVFAAAAAATAVRWFVDQ